MRMKVLVITVFLSAGLLIGCSQQRANTPPAKDNVEQALQQKNIEHVNVDEDRDKGVITLKGDVASDEQRRQAAEVAQAAAPGRVIANELAVRPQGAEDTAKKIDSNMDDAIESNFKAQIAAHHWENQHVNFDAVNGVLTLKGDVDNQSQRTAMERVAAKVPGVHQVVNELEVKTAKRR